MNKVLLIMATAISALALYLPTRTQAFTRVTVDGGSIRLLVAGQGPATVVFESGGGAGLEMWGKVQPVVSEVAKTVSYDRVGLGLSDAAPVSKDPRRIAATLRRALREAGIDPPYVLAGASLGGTYVRVFADMYPEDVAGLVLVDPTVTPELMDTAIAGLPVLLIDAISPVDVPFANGAIRARRAANRAEIAADSAAYRAWIDRVPGGRLILAENTGHNVAIERPRIVIDAIRHIVGAAVER